MCRCQIVKRSIATFISKNMYSLGLHTHAHAHKHTLMYIWARWHLRKVVEHARCANCVNIITAKRASWLTIIIELRICGSTFVNSEYIYICEEGVSVCQRGYSLDKHKGVCPVCVGWHAHFARWSANVQLFLATSYEVLVTLNI